MILLKPFERLQLYWADSQSDVTLAPASEEDIQALERRYNIQLPGDFREYLLKSCPAQEYAMDADYTCWWPLSQIKNIPDEYEYGYEIRDAVIAAQATRYLFFADQMIWAWAWAIACTDDENRGRIALIGGKDRFVAADFADFVERYVENVASVC